MTKKGSRDKGKRGERLAADEFNARGFTAKRTGFAQSNPELQAGDITVKELPNHHFEVKNQQRPQLPAAYRQAKEAAADGQTPVVLVKRNREEFMAYLSLADLLELLKLAKVEPQQFIPRWIA